MLVLRPSGKWRMFIAVLALMIVIAILIGIMSDALRGIFSVRGGDLGMLVFFGIPLIRYLMDLRRPQFLVMRGNDIHWQRRGKKTETIPWSQIVEIKPNRFEEVVEFKLRDGSKTIIPREFWPKSITISDFADIVRRRWRDAADQHNVQSMNAVHEDGHFRLSKS